MYEPLTQEIDIQRLLPPALSDIKEFVEITQVENKNFNKARIDLLGLFKMRFIHDSDESGIARWEKMLNIKRRASDSIDLRKLRVLAKLNNQIPYTWKSLHQYLSSVLNEGKFKVRLDTQSFNIYFDIYGNIPDYKLLLKNIEEMLPLNLWYEIAQIISMPLIVIKHKSYSFDIPYLITNTFQTADVPGKLAKESATVQHRSYTFDTLNPICGTFVTSTINSVTSNLNVELANEYRDIAVLYRRAGENTITGEGEI